MTKDKIFVPVEDYEALRVLAERARRVLRQTTPVVAEYRDIIFSSYKQGDAIPASQPERAAHAGLVKKVAAAESLLADLDKTLAGC